LSSYPDGLDGSLFVRRPEKKREEPLPRTAITPYIWKNQHIFRLGKIKCDIDLSRMRWTVDDERDLRFVTEIYEGIKAGERVFHMEEVLRFLRSRPDVLKINASTMRNEGYAKSLRKDRTVKKAG
jgi:spore coat polysaccharide biosynthesis protein SpsF (cytidylyltransferase family)